jgi:hypothetical protein
MRRPPGRFQPCACRHDAHGISDYGTAVASAVRPDGNTQALKDYIAELKEELEDAEERLKELEK